MLKSTTPLTLALTILISNKVPASEINGEPPCPKPLSEFLGNYMEKNPLKTVLIHTGITGAIIYGTLTLSNSFDGNSSSPADNNSSDDKKK
jgi:hypothetical protein